MTTQPVMALDEPCIDPDRGIHSPRTTNFVTRLGIIATRVAEKALWMFRRSEALGWVLALALNVSAAGWLGLAIWTFIFAVSILLETAAEPIEAA